MSLPEQKEEQKRTLVPEQHGAQKRTLVIPHEFPTVRDLLQGFDMVSCTNADCAHPQCMSAKAFAQEQKDKALAKQHKAKAKNKEKKEAKAQTDKTEQKDKPVADPKKTGQKRKRVESSAQPDKAIGESEALPLPAAPPKAKRPRTRWIVTMHSGQPTRAFFGVCRSWYFFATDDELRDQVIHGPVGALWPTQESAIGHAVQLVWERLTLLNDLDKQDAAYFAERIREAPESAKTLELLNGLLVDAHHDEYELVCTVSEHKMATVPRKRKSKE
jgi:hypothetical protein